MKNRSSDTVVSAPGVLLRFRANLDNRRPIDDVTRESVPNWPGLEGEQERLVDQGRRSFRMSKGGSSIRTTKWPGPNWVGRMCSSVPSAPLSVGG
jgi:hypothetical protein